MRNNIKTDRRKNRACYNITWIKLLQDWVEIDSVIVSNQFP